MTDINAVYGSILENLREIEIIYTPTVSVFRGDRGNTGDSREFTVNEFISRYLPADYKVKKAKIYSQSDESNSIDCVVLAPNHPALITPFREVVLAEGVYAAVEVKPDISTLTENSEFMRGLLQIKSVKNLNRNIEQIDLSKLTGTPQKPPYFKKIPAVLFSSKSSKPKETTDFIISKVDDGTLTKEELPDIIVTLDNGVIFYTPHFSQSAVNSIFESRVIQLLGEEVFLHYSTPNNDRGITLVIFLILFLNLTPPTLLTHKFILKEYLDNILKNNPDDIRTTPYPIISDLEKANLVLRTLFGFPNQPMNK